MRIIDADAYATELWKQRENYQMLDDTHTADKIMHGIYRAEQLLKDAPTVDAVPVVRCRDCKYYFDDTQCCGYVNGLMNVTKADYCSYGRRKQDG